MKTNNIFNLLVLISFLGIIITSCKKDEKEENKDNFAAAFEGTYTEDIGGTTSTTTITRISNNRVNLQYSFNNSIDKCLDSVDVTSASTFSINEYDGCRGRQATGGGTLSGSTLNYSWTSTGGSGVNMTFTGTK